jgi:hypothetical protein
MVEIILESEASSKENRQMEHFSHVKPSNIVQLMEEEEEE